MPKTRKGLKPGRRSFDETQKRKTLEESAYFRWLARNREHGKDLDDWLDAEQEMMENIFDHDVEG